MHIIYRMGVTVPTTHTSFDFSALSVAERLLLIQDLADSVRSETTPLTAEQLAEVDESIREIDAGEAQCEPWESAKARLLRDL